MTPSLRARLQDALPVAMKARDRSAVDALRTALGAIANAEAVDLDGDHEQAGLRGDVARRELTEDDVRSIVAAERDDILATATVVRRHGREAEADELAAKAAVLDAHLDAAAVADEATA